MEHKSLFSYVAMSSLKWVVMTTRKTHSFKEHSHAPAVPPLAERLPLLFVLHNGVRPRSRRLGFLLQVFCPEPERQLRRAGLFLYIVLVGWGIRILFVHVLVPVAECKLRNVVSAEPFF